MNDGSCVGPSYPDVRARKPKIKNKKEEPEGCRSLPQPSACTLPKLLQNLEQTQSGDESCLLAPPLFHRGPERGVVLPKVTQQVRKSQVKGCHACCWRGMEHDEAGISVCSSVLYFSSDSPPPRDCSVAAKGMIFSVDVCVVGKRGVWSRGISAWIREGCHGL